MQYNAMQSSNQTASQITHTQAHVPLVSDPLIQENKKGIKGGEGEARQGKLT